MTALVIGNDRKTEMQEGPDQFGILQGVLGKAMDYKHGSKRAVGLPAFTVQGAAVITWDPADIRPFLQPGQDSMIHHITV